MSPSEAERVGELLIEEGVVTQEELLRAISDGGMKGTALAALLEGCPHVKRGDLAAFLASDFRVPVVDDLRRFELHEDLAKAVPEDLARKHELVPVARLGGLLCVAKPNYYNRAALLELRKVTNLKVKVLQADEAQVKGAIEKLYRGKGVIPAPREARQADTKAFRATPPRPSEESALDAFPLISMPDEGPRPAAARSAEMARAEFEEVVEILDAVKIPSQEYAAVARDPFSRLVLEFDETFRVGKAVPPHRVA